MTEMKGEYNLSPPREDDEPELSVDLVELLRVAVENYIKSTGSVMTSEWFQNVVLIHIALQLDHLNYTLAQLIPSNTGDDS